jgi:hypothetical protein
MLRILWADMDRGGFSAALVGQVLSSTASCSRARHEDGYSLLLTPRRSTC